ncbi:hypothetical protein KFL_002760080 [Klebsormidium nitens]|uniref:Uncharacterized protein n=1 Tax=Klebsormidium nitens TaxID=105231 RepID=A0A1Y1IAR2_KLENI|nr:hypothetical protein KFL_002760080 [Klebsormidium nitens]|eukprot:GAQ86211.1 hypothetical protein KFL_002760080 [Klebsormidium nitens]
MANTGFQAWDGARVCSAAEKVCRVAPAGLAQQVAHAVTLALALGREEVVRVLWGGGVGITFSATQTVRQQWGILTGLSNREARIRGLVEDDLALRKHSRQRGPRCFWGYGRGGVQRTGSPPSASGGFGSGLDANDVRALHDQIKELELKQLADGAEVRRLRSDLTRLRRGVSEATPGGEQGDRTMLMLQADGADEVGGLAWQIRQVQQQLDDHQATLVKLRAEAGSRGQRVSTVEVRLERDSKGRTVRNTRWFEMQSTGGNH